MITSEAQIEKFKDPFVTAKGETRAWVDFTQLKTLWFNTGTLCNLTCDNCYIESSPKNDRLSYLNLSDVTRYMDEIEKDNLGTQTLAFTGGEPFLNPNMLDILEECLSRDYNALVLTNAYRVLDRHHGRLLKLNQKYGNKLQMRISLDHYTKEIHEEQRGAKTFDKTMLAIRWLSESGFNISIAGRSLISEDTIDAKNGFQQNLNQYGIKLSLDEKNLVIFPEMQESDQSVPEITTACWDILKKKPSDQMCATERMVVKKKGSETPVLQACTLLAYDQEFETGSTLKESMGRVQLNHNFCAKFCVLGGSSCSSTV